MKLKLCLFVFLVLFGCKDSRADFGSVDGVKIISLAPSITSILFKLGAGKYVAGVTDFCRYEGEIEKLIEKGQITRVAGFNSYNYEKIVSLNPDVIFCTDSLPIENYKMLLRLFDKNTIIPLKHPKNIEGVFEQIRIVGKTVNKTEEVVKLTALLNERLSVIESKAAMIKTKKRVLVELYFPPFITSGKNTFINDIIVKAGGVPAADLNEDWPSITLEDVIKINPDVIIKAHNNEDASLKKKVLNAYKEERIYIPNDIDSFLQPGISTVNAVEDLHFYLYSNNF